MYSWYWQAEMCYAYLGDVPNKDDDIDSDDVFVKSKWSTRGWTLQELLAPMLVESYGHDWKLIGTKSSFIRNVQEATQMEMRHLQDRDSVHHASIAAIFS